MKEREARERAQQWIAQRLNYQAIVGPWIQCSADDIAQLLLQVEAQARLAALQEFGRHNLTAYGGECRLCEEMGTLRELLAELRRSQAGAEGGNDGVQTKG